MRSITATATETLRSIKAEQGIVGISLSASAGVTRVYPFDGSGVTRHRDYYVVGGTRFRKQEATVRHHEDGTFSVLKGGRIRNTDTLAEGLSNIHTAISIAVEHVVSFG